MKSEIRSYTGMLIRSLPVVVFLAICYLLANSVYGEERMLAGPVGLFRTLSMIDNVVGVILTIPLLLLIFAILLTRNILTVAMSIIGILAWIALGFCIEASASC